MSTAIIILTLDEIDGVRAIVPKLNNDWAEEIIFVDGGSKDGALEILGLERMVIGHTPFIIQGISPACNKKLYRVDIGASKAFKKFQENYPARPQVLEILEDVSVNVLT